MLRFIFLFIFGTSTAPEQITLQQNRTKVQHSRKYNSVSTIISSSTEKTEGHTKMRENQYTSLKHSRKKHNFQHNTGNSKVKYLMNITTKPRLTCILFLFHRRFKTNSMNKLSANNGLHSRILS